MAILGDGGAFIVFKTSWGLWGLITGCLGGELFFFVFASGETLGLAGL